MTGDLPLWHDLHVLYPFLFSPIFTCFSFITIGQKVHSNKTKLPNVPYSAQLWAKPAGAPAARRQGMEGAGEEPADEEPRDARWVPTAAAAAAATPEQVNHAVRRYSLLFNLFTLVTPHCHTHCWLHWINVKGSAVYIVYLHLTAGYDMLILLYIKKKKNLHSEGKKTEYQFQGSQCIYSGVQKEVFGVPSGIFLRLKFALANVRSA